jgi:hypothetical protein
MAATATAAETTLSLLTFLDRFSDCLSFTIGLVFMLPPMGYSSIRVCVYNYAFAGLGLCEHFLLFPVNGYGRAKRAPIIG